ncbi:NAD(P)-dependent oxidoreductase [Allorhizocola rhizosphaerae]|uniref:NAD(P)-dependent oxidoreductase n=1 Tax=Allorhizocola rhizosphaerae TaxID=1872709 RepID=UPI001FE3B53E|nr:NAD(P)-dependent oxidoreductase [Allorhizocola rhizosphaerae]
MESSSLRVLDGGKRLLTGLPLMVVAAFALTPRLFADLFPEDVRKRIHAVATVVPDLTSDVEVLLTGWGCPRMELARMPRLGTILHAAGSVKGYVSPEAFERGIVVSSAAQVNARPVAEYTVAALVLGLKRAFRHARHYAGGRPELGHMPGEASGVSGTVIGIAGFSRIGRMVAAKLRDYDVRVLVSDPYVPEQEIPRSAPSRPIWTRFARSPAPSPSTPPSCQRPVISSTGGDLR